MPKDYMRVRIIAPEQRLSWQYSKHSGLYSGFKIKKAVYYTSLSYTLVSIL